MGSSLRGFSSSSAAVFSSNSLRHFTEPVDESLSPRESLQLHSTCRSTRWRSLQQECLSEDEAHEGLRQASRRTALFQLVSAVFPFMVVTGCNSRSALAVTQNMLAGRIPGLSDPDQSGLRTYRRPDAKSGGHGVGWSPIIPYSFKVPTDWEEIPVSIADLGGTEIDLRFQSPAEGNISVVVAPVLRFASDLGDNVKIEDVGVPEKVIDAFGPELTGATVEGKVKSMDVRKYAGRTYYQYELEIPHMLISATAAGNRLYLFSATGNGRQWKKYSSNLKDIRDSFRVG